MGTPLRSGRVHPPAVSTSGAVRSLFVGAFSATGPQEGMPLLRPKGAATLGPFKRIKHNVRMEKRPIR